MAKIIEVPIPVKTPTVRALKGTQNGNFFTVFSEGNGIAAGARATSESLSQKLPGKGVETRIRVESTGYNGLDGKTIAYLKAIGFSQGSGSHYSVVTLDAPTVAQQVRNYLEA